MSEKSLQARSKGTITASLQTVGGGVWRAKGFALLVGVFLLGAASALWSFSRGPAVARSPAESALDPAPVRNEPGLELRGAVLAHIHQPGKGYGSARARIMHGHLRDAGYNVVQLNTFVYMRSAQDPALKIDGDPTLSDAHLSAEIAHLRELGLQVMLKPHVWVGGWRFDPDNWNGAVDFESPEARQAWFDQYTAYLVAQGRMAEATGAQFLVVGTELTKLVRYDTEWRALIQAVRKVFKGQLTYASEGWHAGEVPFWDALDFIGIDAYYPLSQDPQANIAQLVQGWQAQLEQLEALSKRVRRPVVLTELGYRSQRGSFIRPWEWEDAQPESQETQRDAFIATSIALRNRAWLKGIFVWKYFTDLDSYEREGAARGFSPYQKLAEPVLKTWLKSVAEVPTVLPTEPRR